ncbi:MAG: hypothetical protein KatS3mg115_2185 [Candidatus Poribacteria bacterium]|nr:MAG: hypothetical protein KatS3mg115_2185 [Candidatus Poribacteria bacterium]
MEVNVGDWIIAAVAQDPFPSGGNLFCTLVPICDLSGALLTEEQFPNRGLIWWRVIDSVREHAVRRNLVKIQLAYAPAYDEKDRSKDFFQVERVEPLAGTAMPILPLDEYQDSETLIRRGTIPAVAQRIGGPILLVTGDEVTGPWKIEGEDVSGLRKRWLVRPASGDRVWRWSWSLFEKKIPFVRRSAKIILDFHWNKFEKVTYQLVLNEVLPKAYALGEQVDAIPDREILGRLGRALANPSHRRQLLRFFDEAMPRVREMPDLSDYLPRVQQIAGELRHYEEALRPLLDALTRSEEFLPLLERRIDELAQAHIQERRKELEARVHAEIQELIARRERLEDELRQMREAFEDERRRLRAQLEQERAEHLRILREKEREIQEREQEAARQLQAAVQALTERQQELIAQYLALAPLLESSRRPASQEAPEQVSGVGEFSLPPFVVQGVTDAEVPEERFLEAWTEACREAGYLYAEGDLIHFHIAVKSERMTLIAGASGTGKSTLPRLYAQALHGFLGEDRAPERYLAIPVRPGWTDIRELLGYFNVLERRFEPSPTGLFELLVCAYEEEQRGQSGVYLVHLDELNLSQVEHYFAEVLAALQNPEGQQRLRCFSPGRSRPDDPFAPYAELPLARALRFTGTVNTDEIGKPLSLRLLDRVNVLELQVPSLLPATAESAVGGRPLQGVESLPPHLSGQLPAMGPPSAGRASPRNVGERAGADPTGACSVRLPA